MIPHIVVIFDCSLLPHSKKKGRYMYTRTPYTSCVHVVMEYSSKKCRLFAEVNFDCMSHAGFGYFIHWKSWSARLVMAWFSWHNRGCAVVRLEMLSVVRKYKVMTKKVILLKATSWVKEWLRSGAPRGPRWRAWAVGSVDFQWGWELWGIGWWRGSDSPSIDWCEELVSNLCCLRWFWRRGNGLVRDPVFWV